MKALLVRHGHTEINDTGTYFSLRDPGLSALGVKQVAFLVSMLKNMDIAAIFSSPMKRAVRTAAAIGKQKGLAVQIDARLREINTGAFEGMNSELLKKEDPGFLLKWQTDPADLVWPEGESLRSTGQRVEAMLREKAGEFGSNTVVFVSHGLAIKAVLCLLTGQNLADFREIAIDPASYSVVDVRLDGVSPVVINVFADGSDT